MKQNRYPLRSAFFYFRKVWSPRASYHLARMRYDEDWKRRLSSFFWLLRERVPPTGECKSIDFRGMKL